MRMARLGDKLLHSENAGRVSYLLRLWRAERDGRIVWRASLQDPDTGERQGFATLADLLAFLEGKYGSDAGAKTDPQADTV